MDNYGMCVCARSERAGDGCREFRLWRPARSVDATRWASYQTSQATGLSVSTGSGGRTRWNWSRSR